MLKEIGKLENSSGVHTLEWVAHQHVPEYWNIVLEKMMEHRELWEFHETPENVLTRLFAGELQLHLIRGEKGIEAVGITEFANYTTNMTDLIGYFLFGADYKNWVGLLDSLEMWGAQMGAQRIRIEGRPGWSRPLKALGYTQERVVLCKPLAQRMH